MVLAKDINNDLDKLEEYVKDATLVLADLYAEIHDIRELVNSHSTNEGSIYPADAASLETEIKEDVNDHAEMMELYHVKPDVRERMIWSDILRRFS